MDAAEAIKNAPTDVLCRAAGALQAAHDYVETHEFSMGYGHERGAMACCFIGSVRQAAQEHTVGPSGPSRHSSSDLALQALDRAARVRGYRGRTALRSSPGGIAESTIIKRNDGMSREGNTMKKPEALETYRQAIREVQAELMERKDVPVLA